ncbi:hypothetical protein [Pseudomonas sp. M2]|uniref:hypothetical protein n=1 Tax=Pseudomonas sp. M2 TaxID=228756 RepID=UPI0018CA9CEA|nr:hypothetical protein [Pseudomonas sp. M2]MBG6127349.1 hypothetical protein [Pseudomonas sp. M2]HDS1746428.1 hypothetical protein [Pseudomonas putida]
MPTENRSSNTELSKIVTEALVGMVSGVTGMKPPPGEPLPGFIQAPIDRAVTRISGLLAQPVQQPHPEPIAWMVDTAIWWTKEEAERDSAAAGLPIVPVGPLVSIPDGYCLMPKRLTAENGAKALLLGEFKLEVTQECPECRELDEPVEGCEICDGEGEYGQRHMIPWDKIKFIYSEAVKGLALQPNNAR